MSLSYIIPRMNSTRTTSWAEGMLEAAVIAAALTIPLFVNYYGHRVFELGKAALALELGAVAALGVLVVFGETVGRGGARGWPAALRAPDRGSRALVVAAVLLLVATLVATIASIAPRYSLSGSPERAQGLVAFLAVLALFAAAAVAGRRPARRRRMIAAIAAGGVPVAIAALAQALGMQAVAGDVESQSRVFGTLSNPIFLGAYLMLLAPLVISRLALAWREGRPGIAAAWFGVLLLQLIALILSGSRGPVVGLGAGLLVMGLAWAAVSGRRKVAAAALGIGLVGLLALGALNLAVGPESTIAQAPVIGRFAQIGRTAEGSQAVRLRVWETTAELIADTSPGRLLVGHGPESLRFALLPYGRTHLGGPGQGDRLVDRAHDVPFDALTMTGLLGLLAQIGVWAAWLAASAGAAGLAISPRARRPLAIMLSLGALGGAAAWFVRPAFTGAMIAIGLWLGFTAWLVLRALQSRMGEAGDTATIGDIDTAARNDQGMHDIRPPVPWTALALMAAGAALVVEAAFGIQTIATQTVAWILAGLVVATAADASAGDAHGDLDTSRGGGNIGRPLAAAQAGAVRSKRGRSSTAHLARGAAASPVASATREGAGLGLVFGLAMAMVFYALLLYGVDRTPDTLPVLIAIAVSAWFAGLLAALDAGADPIAYALPSLGGAALWYLAQTVTLLVARDVGVLYVVLLTWIMLMVVLAGLLLGPSEARAPLISGPIAGLYPVVAIVVVALLYGAIAPRVRADMYFRSAVVNFDVALAQDDQQRFQDAEAIFARATALYAGDDQMYSAWGERYTVLGGLVPSVEQQQEAYDLAQSLVTRAEVLNPAMPYHTFNRGHIQLLFAEQLASQGRMEDAATVAADSEVAIQTVFDVVPYDPSVANELALAKLLRGRVDEAISLLEYSRDTLDSENGQTYQLLSRAYDIAGRSEDAEAALTRSLQYGDASQQDPGALLQLGDMARRDGDVMLARTYYERAVEMLGPRVDWAIMFNLGLLFRDTREYNGAIQALNAALTLAEGDPQAQEQIQAALMDVLQQGPSSPGGAPPFSPPGGAPP